MTVQVEPRRPVRPEPGSRMGPPFVLVTGGKGGVGKTTVAANLGVELGRRGANPVICDLDFGPGNPDAWRGGPPGRTGADQRTGQAGGGKTRSSAF